jgi:ferredoxin
MTDKIIEKDQWNGFVKELCSKYRVFGPIRGETRVEYAEIADGQDVLFEFTNSDQSPKKFIFPQTECLLHFKNKSPAQDPEAMIMKEEPPMQHRQVLLNLRPCDAKAFSVLDQVFCKDEQAMDVYWKDKRDKTIYLGLACKEPCPTCFCSSVNCGPHHEQGLDALFVDLGHRLLARPLTQTGQEVLSELKEADQESTRQAKDQKEQAEAAIQSQVGMQNILSRTVLEEYEHPYWDRVFETCLNCGICTYYCPTCHCFDIQDEVQDDYGRRIRTWDTCMSWLFTQHTSGHNPRGSKKDRVRQRFMHKFKYMPLKLNESIGCVGCGRCTQKCPVNIDIREVINKVNE